MNVILKSFKVSVHSDGWKFIVPSVILALISIALVDFNIAFYVFVFLSFFMVYFFRDPVRVTPSNREVLVAPADGLFVDIVEAAPPPELRMGNLQRCRVSIFLNVFDVHVNRIPVSGTIGALVYRPGRLLSTALSKASEENERMAVRIDRGDRGPVAVCQIAGPVVRRIRCDLTTGQPVICGQRYGIIRFGSRVDVYLPVGASPLVLVGQRSVAGETVIANL